MASSDGDLSFLVDASMPRSSTDTLRKAGFEAEDVRSIDLGGAPDDRIIEEARDNDQIVHTRDTDFGQVLRHPEHPGALILRLPYTFTSSDINERLRAFLDEVDPSELSEAIVIVELDRYRRRPLDREP